MRHRARGGTTSSHAGDARVDSPRRRRIAHLPAWLSHQAARGAVLALAYYTAAILSLNLALVESNVTPLWPPTGIAVAALLAHGVRLWPAIALAAFLVNAPISATPLAAAGIATGNTLAPVLAASLLRRVGFRRELDRLNDVAALVILAALLSMLVSASVGSLTLVLSGTVPPGGLAATWSVWWAGDAMGVLVVTPFLLALSRLFRQPRLPWSRRLEAAGLFGLLIAATLVAVTSRRGAFFLILPFLGWTAWRFHQTGAAVGALLVTGLAVAAAVGELGSFGQGSLLDRMLTLQALNATAAFTSFVVAAVAMERGAAHSALEAAGARLEERVRTRTSELTTANARLEREVVERQEAEARLRHREQQLAMAQRVARIGSWEWEIAPNKVSWTDELFRLYGLEPESIEVSYEDFLVRVHPDDRKHVERIIERAYEDHHPFEFDHRIVLPDGQVRVARGRGEVVLDEGGNPIRMVGTAQDVTDRKRLEEQSALRDPLTGLPNRPLFLDRVGQSLARTARRPEQVAVLFIDLDRFKLINDSLGHEIGDRLLVEVGRRLRSLLRPSDTAARLGGDEFVVVVEVIDEKGAVQIAERIAAHLSRPMALGSGELVVTASIGIAIGREDGEAPEGLLRNADSAMYRAKGRGRRGFEIFDAAMRARAMERLNLENELRSAINTGELELYYQPQARLLDGAIVGIEALVRWRHPQRGMLPPSDFIYVAEETGLISSLGTLVLKEACRQCAAWGVRVPLRLAINVSTHELARPGYPELVERILAESAVPADRISLEITESALMVSSNLAALQALQDLGVHLVIDDFGTGYSSLNYLRQFQLDFKLDRSFVSGLGHNREDQAIAEAVLGLGRRLGLSVVAEGVESPEQVDQLLALGCELGQGYHFARPLPAAGVGEMIASKGSASLPATPSGRGG